MQRNSPQTERLTETAKLKLYRAIEWLSADALLGQFAEQGSIARRRYKIFVEEGIGRESLWSELKGQIYLGDDRFVTRTQARLDGAALKDVNIPRPQRRDPQPPLNLIGARHQDRTGAMVVAHETGQYSYRQIGEHFGLHFTTVGRMVREARKNRGNNDGK